MNRESLTLIGGLSLTRYGSHYILGNRTRSLLIEAGVEYAALAALARGHDLFDDQIIGRDQVGKEIATQLIAKLKRQNFLITTNKALTMPKRYLDEVTERDVSANQLRDRALPELVAAQWIDGRADGGATTVSARNSFHIELSGRSRVITLLHAILLSSGISVISSSDFDDAPNIGNSDIGVAGISPTDIGTSYYARMEEMRQHLSLFPTSRSQRRDQGATKPLLIIHYGRPTPDLIADWMTTDTAHLVITGALGDHCTVGPLVIPRQTPCLRCLTLFEFDQLGWSNSESVTLTPQPELPMHLAHTIAGVAASAALNFIDMQSDEIERERQTLLGSFLDFDFHRSATPQMVAISRHPLCGCHDFM